MPPPLQKAAEAFSFSEWRWSSRTSKTTLYMQRRILSHMFIYPENLKAKPMLWLWELRDIGIIGVSFLLSVLALAQGMGMPPLVITVLYAFLAIRVDGSSILDFLRRAACFLFLEQQYYEWRLDP